MDPSGLIVETGWDLFNVAQGVVSLFCNLSQGNIAGAFVDAAGLGYDILATAVPGVPAGGGQVIKVVRLADVGRPLVRSLYRAAENAQDAKSLIRYGVRKGLDEAHHIVAENATAAAFARKRLKDLGIDLNDPTNGVALPKVFHRPVYSQSYYDMINNAATRWHNRADAEQGLAVIAEKLLKESGKLR